MAHPNADLLTRLFTSLARHDHEAMAACYHPDSTFTDIAFDLRGRRQIHAMWHMISEGDLRSTFIVRNADDRAGVAAVTDDYTFRATGKPVHNVIESHFRFRDGLIEEQRDFCDEKKWAEQALGGLPGFLAGRLRFVRSMKARQTLNKFIAAHPEYR